MLTTIKVKDCNDCLFLAEGGWVEHTCLHPLVLKREAFVSLTAEGAFPYANIVPCSVSKCPLEKNPVKYQKG